MMLAGLVLKPPCNAQQESFHGSVGGCEGRGSIWALGARSKLRHAGYIAFPESLPRFLTACELGAGTSLCILIIRCGCLHAPTPLDSRMGAQPPSLRWQVGWASFEASAHHLGTSRLPSLASLSRPKNMRRLHMFMRCRHIKLCCTCRSSKCGDGSMSRVRARRAKPTPVLLIAS
ncbi:hypothetical protein AcW1_008752 [Taiwanofungus camphoratus]|nr:hypothetical protein AcW1_008752 [Antrodia cinnamomea]